MQPRLVGGEASTCPSPVCSSQQLPHLGGSGPPAPPSSCCVPPLHGSFKGTLFLSRSIGPLLLPGGTQAAATPPSSPSPRAWPRRRRLARWAPARLKWEARGAGVEVVVEEPQGRGKASQPPLRSAAWLPARGGRCRHRAPCAPPGCPEPAAARGGAPRSAAEGGGRCGSPLRVWTQVGRAVARGSPPAVHAVPCAPCARHTLPAPPAAGCRQAPPAALSSGAGCWPSGGRRRWWRRRVGGWALTDARYRGGGRQQRC